MSDSVGSILPIVAGIVIIGALIAAGFYYLHGIGRWKIYVVKMTGMMQRPRGA